MNLKRGLSILISTLAVTISVKAADIKGYVNTKNGPAQGYPVECYSEDSDTFKTITDTMGLYKFPADSFQRGDTIIVRARDSLDTKSGKTKYVVKGSGNHVPEFYVAEQGKPNLTFNMRWIDDTSNVHDSIPLYMLFYSKKNPGNRCSTIVDTSVLPPHYNGVINVGDSSLKHGDSAFISLEKYFDSILLRTLIGFEKDTSTFNAMQVLRNGNTGAQSIKFPLETIVDSIGVEEELPAKGKKSIYPILCLGMFKVNGKEVEFWDICGNYLGKRKSKNGKVDVRNFPSGIYFSRSKNKTRKFIKLNR